MAVEYTSGSIKIPGLGNGTDYSTMIDQLEKIEMKHALQLSQWKSDWQQRLDAFDQISLALAEYSSALKTMNSESTFLAKLINCSDERVASVKADGSADNSTHKIEVNQLASNSYAYVVFDVENASDKIRTGNTIGQFEFSLNGESHSIDIPPGTTLVGLKNIINNKFGSPGANKLGMKATIVESGGKQMLQLYSTQTGSETQIRVTSNPFDTDKMATSWDYQDGTNAQVRVNGFPSGSDWREITTNTITSIPGVTINLLNTGNISVGISTDTEHIKTAIETFVEATNTLRSTMFAFTRVDSGKTTVDSDYSESLFDTQKGGVLTGNYGMQLVMSKMKSCLMSKPVGFEYLELNEFGVPVSGDTFAALSHLGIKTDDVQGSLTYGLLVFENNIQAIVDGETTMITLDDAIEMDPEGIAELFAAKNKVSIDSSNFGYVNMANASKPGNYDVSYEVGIDGKVTSATINGKPAKIYDDNTIMLVRGEGADNDADGILLEIYNNTPTNGTPHTGTVRMKNGMLNELISMIDVDFLDPDSGDKDTLKGTIPVLQTQYKQVIANINDKIAKEDQRLITWRRRMEDRFSKMETTLKLYSNLQAQLESQIASLSSSKKS